MSFGGNAVIFRRTQLLVLVYLAAGIVAVKASYAQEYDDPAPAYYQDQAREPETRAEEDNISVDDLEALLPDHLRTPLPVKEDSRLEPIAQEDGVSTEPPSAIERFYREAADDPKLTQYGYEFIGVSHANGIAPAAGAVQDDYILGAGDRINVAFLGERKDRRNYVVDRAGSLAIDQLPPIAAAGKTLGAVRADINAMLKAQSYYGEAYLTLENVRQVGVLVAGYVARPGRHALSPMHTAIEALERSGGVTKQGSLRQIRLVRGGNTIPIDLYGMMNNTGAFPQLQDGDRIIVPPLGPTIAITGDVRQPGIYELPNDEKMSVLAALDLAGGPTARGQNRVVLQTPQNDGQRVATLVSATSGATISDGAILSINRTIDRSAASFTLQGETRKGGTYPLVSGMKLSRILRDPQAFGDDVYPLLGVISRRRDADLVRDLVAFSPQDVFTGRADVTLQDGDQVRLFARDDVKTVMHDKKVEGLPDLIETFIHEHGVSLQGAVRQPGVWPVAGPTAIARVLDVAGGSLSDADLSRAEINRNDVGLIEVSAGAVSRRDVIDLSDAGGDEITVTFGDAVRIPDRFEAVTRQTVALYGEVRNPGNYDLMRGDTLLTLIDRAGGVTDQAYPMGAVFSRAAERKREKEKFGAAARDLERAIAMAAQNDDGKVDMTQMALAKDLVEELKTIEPVGRITVESDPGVLRRDPALDILLESGDRVYIPKRPLTVRVTGEVLSPAALQFRADKDTGDYVAEAGGTTMHADKGRMFVLYPNGSAQPIRGKQWTSIKPLMITPGSTIVVPRDPKPFDFIESAKDITQILSNLAITGIYADELIDRNRD